MEAKVIDLRYRMNDVLRALARNEEVSILYHGKLKGVIKPVMAPTSKRMVDHPFFNMLGPESSVEDQMDEFRGGRYGDL